MLVYPDCVPLSSIPEGGTQVGDAPSVGGTRGHAAMAEAANSADIGRAISAACGGQPEEVLQLECHVDHLTGEEIGAAIEALSTMPEVLDVLWLGGIGKKNRPCGLLRLLCLPAHGPCVGAATVRHTHSLGLRWQLVGRTVLPRRPVVKENMPAKRYTVDGQDYVRVECDALKAAAAEAGLGLPALRIPIERDI